MIDDATSWSWGRFVERDTRLAKVSTMEGANGFLEKIGKNYTFSFAGGVI